jgi:hypothetical protein
MQFSIKNLFFSGVNFFQFFVIWILVHHCSLSIAAFRLCFSSLLFITAFRCRSVQWLVRHVLGSFECLLVCSNAMPCFSRLSSSIFTELHLNGYLSLLLHCCSVTWRWCWSRATTTTLWAPSSTRRATLPRPCSRRVWPSASTGPSPRYCCRFWLERGGRSVIGPFVSSVSFFNGTVS